MKKKVFVGLSGGVDSAVATYLLKEQGYDVTGVFMINIPSDTYAGECLLQEMENAKNIASFLEIPFLTIDLKDAFQEKVLKNFYKQYTKGNTPNPCVECNQEIKFGELATRCFELGADYIATGHYAKTKNGSLYKSQDPSKDQTYFLNRISGEILDKTIFPLQDLKKEDVRKIAKDINLPNFDKKDSQKICFLKGRTITDDFKNHPGMIKDLDTNEIVGKHEGIFNFTIGQRQGVKIGGLDKPYFVAKKDSETNTIYVVKGRDNPYLWKSKFLVKDFNFINKKNINIEKGLHGIIRYHSKGSKTTVKWKKENGKYIGIFEFENKQWAPSLGQSLVIYQNDECIGGGEISEILD